MIINIENNVSIKLNNWLTLIKNNEPKMQYFDLCCAFEEQTYSVT